MAPPCSAEHRRTGGCRGYRRIQPAGAEASKDEICPENGNDVLGDTPLLLGGFSSGICIETRCSGYVLLGATRQKFGSESTSLKVAL